MNIGFNSNMNVTRTGDEYFIEFDTISGRNNMWLFTVRLMQIYEHEQYLNNGRFDKMSFQKQEYVVTLEVKGSRPEIMKWFASVVEWIAVHCKGSWSIDPYMDSVGIGHVEFSFSDSNVAVPFALVWK